VKSLPKNNLEEVDAMPETIFKQLVIGIQEIFPETEEMTFNAGLPLGDIPEWDSMAVVNLQTYLESTFQIKVPEEFLGEETTLEEIVAIVSDPQSVGLQAASLG
jgi:acyl carrier protein